MARPAQPAANWQRTAAQLLSSHFLPASASLCSSGQNCLQSIQGNWVFTVKKFLRHLKDSGQQGWSG